MQIPSANINNGDNVCGNKLNTCQNIGHIITRTHPNKNTYYKASTKFHGAIDSSQDGIWSSMHIPVCTTIRENVQNLKYKHIGIWQ